MAEDTPDDEKLKSPPPDAYRRRVKTVRYPDLRNSGLLL